MCQLCPSVLALVQITVAQGSAELFDNINHTFLLVKVFRLLLRRAADGITWIVANVNGRIVDQSLWTRHLNKLITSNVSLTNIISGAVMRISKRWSSFTITRWFFFRSFTSIHCRSRCPSGRRCCGFLSRSRARISSIQATNIRFTETLTLAQFKTRVCLL